MRETWYVLEDGSFADPREVTTDESGKLVHKSGVAVAMRSPGVPSSRGVDPEEERAKAKDMKPEAPKRNYKTRESKAD